MKVLLSTDKTFEEAERIIKNAADLYMQKFLDDELDKFINGTTPKGEEPVGLINSKLK